MAERLKKPLVIEEFGLPRDGQSFDPASATTFRDRYFAAVFEYLGSRRSGRSSIAGANFWAFGGTGRPIKSQLVWKPGDERTGDPPMEEQGLYSIFDGDASTWRVIGQAMQPRRRRGAKGF